MKQKLSCSLLPLQQSLWNQGLKTLQMNEISESDTSSSYSLFISLKTGILKYMYMSLFTNT